ncbi:sigma-54-dependent Fis family transcriptional regulator [Kangiella sp. HD9-110m-PIT-SAG07]|nr:sigma-54-dependent Fis family transcriptional regulator [Kangiella sp. HD9-110m-PIT-SAG07]
MSETKPKVILIDDEADIRHLLTMTLIQMKLDVVSCKDLTEAKDTLSNERFDFCLTDLKLPDGDGLDMVSYCKKHYPDMPIAVITAYSSTEKAIEAMRLGAFDFLSKPIDLNHLRQLLKHAFKFNQSREKPKKDSIYKVLAGNDDFVSAIRNKLAKVKGSQAPVVIVGEPGTEKEALAKIIHQQSSRADNSLVFLDFEAHSLESQEQVVFHNSGTNESYLDRADQGTLVISNLQLLSLPLQKRLLQLIEDKSFIPENETEPTQLDIRVIVCSEVNLSELVEKGLLREDLYFRINVINFQVPSLRERKGDLEAIINSYLQDFNCDKKMSDAALSKLTEHTFPYNYREMENILIKATTLSNQASIEAEDIILIDTSISTKANDNIESNNRGNKPLEEYLEEIEKSEIEKALEQTRWNRTEAAKLLKVSFRTIRYKMKKLGIQ